MNNSGKKNTPRTTDHDQASPHDSFVTLFAFRKGMQIALSGIAYTRTADGGPKQASFQELGVQGTKRKKEAVKKNGGGGSDNSKIEYENLEIQNEVSHCSASADCSSKNDSTVRNPNPPPCTRGGGEVGLGKEKGGQERSLVPTAPPLDGSGGGDELVRDCDPSGRSPRGGEDGEGGKQRFGGRGGGLSSR